MSDRYSGSFFLSLLLHLALAAIFFVVAYVLHPREPEKTQLFEVVRGPGSDYKATEAASEPVTMEPFEFTPPEPLPDPPVVTPEPVIPDPVVPDPVVTPVPMATPVPVPPVRTPPKATPAPQPPKATPKPTPAPKQPTPQPRPQMTKVEFDRQFSKNTTASQRPVAPPAKITPRLIDPSAVRDGLKSSSDGAGGTALSAQMKNQMDAYFSNLLSLLKRNHQKPPGVSDQLEATFSYHVAANGKVSQVRLTRSSGNPAFDQSVLTAFATLPQLGARPDGQSSTRELIFSMRDLR